MIIRHPKENEIDRIMEIYAAARKYMDEHGNPTQWGSLNHPPRDMIVEDIQNQLNYVLEGEDGDIHGVFALLGGIDPTYLRIDDGAWLNDEEYLTVHRIASDGQCHGIFRTSIDFCKTKTDNIRIDTHEDNAIMKHALASNGFVRCGIIYLPNGDPRIAYHYAAKQ